MRKNKRMRYDVILLKDKILFLAKYTFCWQVQEAVYKHRSQC